MNHHLAFRQPKLTFAPRAWLKLQYFCHRGETEVGGFGITASDRPLYIEEFVTVAQSVSATHVAFDDVAVADFFDQSIDRGLVPEQFGRVWLHSHPGNSVAPTSTDERTFARVFGRCHWAVMLILGRTGNTYARLAYRAGPAADIELQVAVDWSAWPAEVTRPLADLASTWSSEFAANIRPMIQTVSPAPATAGGQLATVDDSPWLDEEFLDEWDFSPGDIHEQLRVSR